MHYKLVYDKSRLPNLEIDIKHGNRKLFKLLNIWYKLLWTDIKELKKTCIEKRYNLKKYDIQISIF